MRLFSAFFLLIFRSIVTLLPAEKTFLDALLLLGYKHGNDILFKRRLVEIAFENTFRRNRNNAGFLTYDDDNGIAVFAHADTCAMACSQILYYIRICRKRQEAACGINPLIADYYRAVVERRFVEKYIAKQE